MASKKLWARVAGDGKPNATMSPPDSSKIGKLPIIEKIN